MLPRTADEELKLLREAHQKLMCRTALYTNHILRFLLNKNKSGTVDASFFNRITARNKLRDIIREDVKRLGIFEFNPELNFYSAKPYAENYIMHIVTTIVNSLTCPKGKKVPKSIKAMFSNDLEIGNIIGRDETRVYNNNNTLWLCYNQQKLVEERIKKIKGVLGYGGYFPIIMYLRINKEHIKEINTDPKSSVGFDLLLDWIKCFDLQAVKRPKKGRLDDLSDSIARLSPKIIQELVQGLPLLGQEKADDYNCPSNSEQGIEFRN